MEKTYSVEITETSIEELSKRDRVMLKDTGDAIALDETLPDGVDETLEIEVKDYAILSVHNEKAEDKDYTKYIILAPNGTKYVTGSESFFKSFMDIYTEMAPDAFSIKVYKKPSNNFKGKFFLSCSIL